MSGTTRVLALLGGRRAKSDAEAARLLDHVRTSVGATPGAYVVHVAQVYQRAPRGVKAVLDIEGVGRYKAWFWWGHSVADGQILAVRAEFGWGPHEGHDILYVGNRFGESGIYASLPRGTGKRVNRHYRRAALSQRRLARSQRRVSS